MIAVATRDKNRALRRERSQRLLLDEVSWQDYEDIGRVLRDRPALRITYDQGSLEIMTISSKHEKYKTRMGRFVETLAEEFDLPLEPGGTMTLKRAGLARGLEGDQCYWIQNEKRVRGKLEWDPSIDPPPDLVLEVEISRSALDRLAMYAALGVPEVWCFNGASLRVYLLQPDGTYALSAMSPTFPGIRIAELVRFLQPAPDKDYLRVIRDFRAWVKQQRTRKNGGKRKGKAE